MKTVFKINNLHCEACIKISKMKIDKINGVTDVQINGLDGKKEIMAEREITIDEIQTALDGTEYKVVKI